MLQTTDNLRIRSLDPIPSPALLIQMFPLSQRAIEMILRTRRQVEDILTGKDDRLVVVVGPCSIHDTQAALEYSERLQQVMTRYANDLCIIMRVYFEKPRTTIGWKGLINDPHLDESFNIQHGLEIGRKLLTDLAHRGIPAGTEFLDTIIPQYISDSLTWGAIGARTTESQIHRELTSGLSMPVGFKNGTDGNIKIAIDAMLSAREQHHFLGISKQGIAVTVSTKGNPMTHVILRGSTTGTNYSEQDVARVVSDLQQEGLPPRVMIDCSHGNSNKDHRRQAAVITDVAGQIQGGSKYILGTMLESHLQEGKQCLTKDEPLVYGQSITDACLSWEQTLPLLETLALAVHKRRSQ